MIGTTTRPTATTQPRAAPEELGPPSAVVARIRVTRRVSSAHRTRRDVRLPRVRRADTYLVRVTRPVGRGLVARRLAPAAAPHRLRPVAG